MKIVITDGYTVNPGDLSWESITALGELTVYERSHVNELYERCRDADIVLTNKTPISRELIESLHHLRLIAVLATGYNIVDIHAAKERGIPVSNVPGYGTASVAQHTIALLLELTNKICVHTTSVAKGEWQISKDWSYAKAPVTELDGKTMGIVGMGNIGQRVAKIAHALGMKILYNSRSKKENALGEFTDLHTLFFNSDVVSLHCPLAADNKAFVNEKLLHIMKPSVFLINTSRGQLIHEQELADALNNDIIAGAALDVLSEEPPRNDNPLLTAKNCIITPHNAWISIEARKRIMAVTKENIEAFLQGHPVNSVV